MEINSNILNIHHPVSISGKRKTLDAPRKELVGVVTPPCDTGTGAAGVLFGFATKTSAYVFREENFVCMKY